MAPIGKSSPRSPSERNIETLNTYRLRHHTRTVFLLLALAFLPIIVGEESAIMAQEPAHKTYTKDEITTRTDGIFVPLKSEDGVILPTMMLRGVIVYPERYFRDARQRVSYTRLVRDVKVALPYAKIVARTMMETYEYIQTLPTEKEREKHLRLLEKEVYKQYYPEMRKLTLNQGKILLKLIMRETGGSTSYNLIESFLGSFTAGFWNTVAGFFGTTLKTTWDPYGQDAALERICVEVEQGLV